MNHILDIPFDIIAANLLQMLPISAKTRTTHFSMPSCMLLQIKPPSFSAADGVAEKWTFSSAKTDL